MRKTTKNSLQVVTCCFQGTVYVVFLPLYETEHCCQAHVYATNIQQTTIHIYTHTHIYIHIYIYFYKCQYKRPISVKVPCLPTRSGDIRDNLLHQSRFWRKWPNNCHEHKSCNHDEYAQHWELKTARQTAETVQLLGLCPTPYFQRL